VLDGHHAVLGATDLRAHAAGNRGELADLGLRMALGDGRPRRIFEWLERGRAGYLVPHPVRPPEDPALAAALAELRETVATLNQAPEAVARTGALLRRQVRLERQIRDRLRQLPAGFGGPPPGLVRPEALAGALAERALLEYGQLDGVLHAVTLVDSRVRWHVLGPLAAVRDLVERIPFALRLLIRPGLDQPSRDAALGLLRARGLRQCPLAQRHRRCAAGADRHVHRAGHRAAGRLRAAGAGPGDHPADDCAAHAHRGRPATRRGADRRTTSPWRLADLL
jgi:hypothetical protein